MNPPRTLARPALGTRATRPWLLLALLALGCDSGQDAAVAPAVVRAPLASSPPPPRVVRSQTPELVRLRRHLDFGELEAARALLPSASSAGAEEPLLAARCAALSGEIMSALRSIEAARARNPLDPDVYATAAEIYAAAGKPESAWEEIGRGEQLCGDSPELARAKGIVWLLREGGAERGLDLLERARALDPALPFVERALGQAHLLAGKAALRTQDLDRALVHARRANELDPRDVDTQRFLADVLAAGLDYDGAIAILRSLLAQGEPREGELASLEKRAGIAALLAHERAAALEHFAAARAHGSSDEELSTGARLLLEEARARVAAGVEAYAQGDVDAAEERFRAALHCEPDLIEAQNHLAVVLFQKRAFGEAIALWQSVLSRARAEGLDLPEPVHLNLAKAQFQNGVTAAARATLLEYLGREPDGEWAEQTRAMLERMPER